MDNIIQFPGRQNDRLGGSGMKNNHEAQNASRVDFSEKNATDTTDTTVDAIQKIAESGVVDEKVVMEMPPDENLKKTEEDSEVANSMIRDFGNNGKFGNGNFTEIKKIIGDASNNPHGLNDAIQELSEETSGLKKVA